MKNILIFSNPFGYGPSGKALAIAACLEKSCRDARVYVCGGDHLRSIAGQEPRRFMKADERSESDIERVLDEVGGDRYVISSQNRFAIKAAKRKGVPCAFLDGLAWFWKEIPDDHRIADLIFWLNYPDIGKKIPPEIKDRVHVIHGITDGSDMKMKPRPRKGVLMYVGGCVNPLTDLPTHYLDLVRRIVGEAVKRKVPLELASDPVSRDYLLGKGDGLAARTYGHEAFVSRLGEAKRFVTNGGQTATMEAAGMGTPISFFLPINLSQFALIDALARGKAPYPHLEWSRYVDAYSDSVKSMNEKDAIGAFNRWSRAVLEDDAACKRLSDDFMEILTAEEDSAGEGLMKELGSSGADDMLKVLKVEWGIS